MPPPVFIKSRYDSDDITCKKHDIHRMFEDLKKMKLELYGSKTSMFYGLKPPTLFKICEYICDEYNVPYDVMMDMVYVNLMKILHKCNLDMMGRGFRKYTHVHISFEGLPYTTTCYVCFKGDTQVHTKMRRLEKKIIEPLFLGDIQYESQPRVVNANYKSTISNKSMKQMSDECGIDVKWFGFKSIGKKEIMEQLDKIGIKYKKSMKKEELMKMLVKNK